MSTQPIRPEPPAVAAAPSAAPADDPARAERRKQAALRTAACRQRLRLATDALAAADLLLGMNFSLGSCGKERR